MPDLPPPAFSDALRRAIAARGLSLTEIASRAGSHGFHVSPSTLSMWQSGQRLPQSRESIAVVGVLEEILGTEPNALWDLLTAPTRGRRPVGRTDYARQQGFPPIVVTALERLDMLGPRELDEVSAQATVEIGADRRRTAIRKLQVVRANRQGARRILHGWVDEAGAELAEVTAIHGCAVGRRFIDADAGVHLMELVLPAPLVRNATAVLETTDTFPAHLPEQMDEFQYMVAGRVTQMLLVIRFADGVLPHACETFLVDVDGNEYANTPQSVFGGPHNIVHDFGPGRIGVRWWWDDEADDG